MARTKTTKEADNLGLEDLDVDPRELTDEVEVDENLDAWMAEMLSGPPADDWDF